MSRLARLRQERERLAAQASALNAKYKGGPMPAEDSKSLDEMLTSIEDIDRDIDTEGIKADRASDRWQISGRDVTVLRNDADVQRYYQGRGEGRADSGTIADFVRGVAGLPTTEGIRAALSGGTDSAGGYLLPTYVMPAILEGLVPASSVLSAGAGIIPVDEGGKTFTQAAIDAIPSAAWRAENGAVAESEPIFRGVVATPRSLAFFFKVSRELLADASNIEPALIMAISQAFAKALDLAALRGSGTAPEPRGVLNTTNVQAVSNGANGASLATTKFANLLSAVQKVLEADGPAPTAAIMSPRSELVLSGLVDSTGQPLQAPKLLSEMRRLTTTQIPNNLTVGTSADCSEIYVGDFTRMAFLMRERISIQKVDQLFATNGQIGFICHVRGDVMVQYPKAFAVATGVRP